jgi:pimeloyl-ACP methyl ester carboxylesterase
MSNQPLVVLVHGAWHGAWCWASLQAALDHHGIPSLALDLPGHGASPLPHTDLYGHADYVAAQVARHDGPVVLVGHSYGGAVIGEAAARHGDNVAHLVYIAAFCLDLGESVMGMVTSLPSAEVSLAAAIQPGPQEGLTHLDPALAVPALYGECAPKVAAACVARLGTQSMTTFAQPTTGAPWQTTSSTYVLCSRDQAVHPTHQRRMAERCTTLISLDTDHSPFASRPDATAAVLVSVVGDVEGPSS